MGMTPEQMRKAIISNLPKKTGRGLEEWIKILESQGPKSRKDRIDWLKSEHGIGHGTAQTIVYEAEKPYDYRPPRGDELVDGQYSGDKASLWPIYVRLAREVSKPGKDAELDPCKTYVSLVRKRQFGLIQPSTRTRVDLGLVLPGIRSTDRLKESGSFGSYRITHRVGLTSPDDVDEELLSWLRAAYENS